jgi:hypothetical protein
MPSSPSRSGVGVQSDSRPRTGTLGTGRGLASTQESSRGLQGQQALYSSSGLDCRTSTSSTTHTATPSGPIGKPVPRRGLAAEQIRMGPRYLVDHVLRSTVFRPSAIRLAQGCRTLRQRMTTV